MIDLVIPVEQDSEQLSRTIASIEQYTMHPYKLHIIKQPDLNVSEARQLAYDTLDSQYICYLDYDSEMIQTGWLGELFKSIRADETAGAVFGGEWWGTDNKPFQDGQDHQVSRGPAACMLLDKQRIPSSVKWDTKIGLRNGWLGGDFEEVDYGYRLMAAGLKLIRCGNMLFHHTGGKRTILDFAQTDRFKTVNIMELLLAYKYRKAPDDEDWFKGLEYVKASSADDCMLAGGSNLRECYKNVIARNGLAYVTSFRRLGVI